MFLERSDCRHEHCAGPNLLGCSVSRPSPARGNRGAPAMSHSLHSNQSSAEQDRNFLLPPHPPQARRTAASRGQQLPCQMTQKESMPQLRSFHQRTFMDTGPQASCRLRVHPGHSLGAFQGAERRAESGLPTVVTSPGHCKPPQACSSAATGLPFQQDTLREASVHHGIKGRRGETHQPNMINAFALLMRALVS